MGNCNYTPVPVTNLHTWDSTPVRNSWHSTPVRNSWRNNMLRLELGQPHEQHASGDAAVS